MGLRGKKAAADRRSERDPIEGFEPVAIKPTVSLEDVEKLDIRVGTIERVEGVPRSDKRVRLTVDFGDHRRSILVGMKRERPDASSEVEGRQALFVVKWRAKFRRECCSISEIQTACCRSWPYQRSRSRTAAAPAEPRSRLPSSSRDRMRRASWPSVST